MKRAFQASAVSTRSRCLLVLCFQVCLFCSAAFAQQIANDAVQPMAASEKAAQSLYDKTLSDLGSITLVRIDPSSKDGDGSLSLTETTQHKAVWKIIEGSRLRDYRSIGIAMGLAPRFQLEYANGIKVSADRLAAKVTFQDGTTANYVLFPTQK
jgi:hypothetical protein